MSINRCSLITVTPPAARSLTLRCAEERKCKYSNELQVLQNCTSLQYYSYGILSSTAQKYNHSGINTESISKLISVIDTDWVSSLFVSKFTDQQPAAPLQFHVSTAPPEGRFKLKTSWTDWAASVCLHSPEWSCDHDVISCLMLQTHESSSSFYSEAETQSTCQSFIRKHKQSAGARRSVVQWHHSTHHSHMTWKGQCVGFSDIYWWGCRLQLTVLSMLHFHLPSVQICWSNKDIKIKRKAPVDWVFALSILGHCRNTVGNMTEERKTYSD